MGNGNGNTTPVNRRALGRVAAPDPRDAHFPVTMLQSVVEPSDRTRRFWSEAGWWGDQGQTPQCTAYAWLHWLADGPVTHPGPEPLVAPDEFYGEEQAVDGIGIPHDGSTVRAGAKVLASEGAIASYLWATTLTDLTHTLLNVGPVVVGTDWYASMFDPRGEHHELVIDETVIDPSTGSPLAGGHAYLLNAVDTDQRFFRMKNSWGRTWGHSGTARIGFDTFERLLAAGGEACLAVENKVLPVGI